MEGVVGHYAGQLGVALGEEDWRFGCFVRRGYEVGLVEDGGVRGVGVAHVDAGVLVRSRPVRTP